jgi:hypothetical protein
VTACPPMCSSLLLRVGANDCAAPLGLTSRSGNRGVHRVGLSSSFCAKKSPKGPRFDEPGRSFRRLAKPTKHFRFHIYRDHLRKLHLPIDQIVISVDPCTTTSAFLYVSRARRHRHVFCCRYPRMACWLRDGKSLLRKFVACPRHVSGC